MAFNGTQKPMGRRPPGVVAAGPEELGLVGLAHSLRKSRRLLAVAELAGDAAGVLCGEVNLAAVRRGGSPSRYPGGQRD